MKNRAIWIDSLKGIAMFAVVMVHCNLGSLPFIVGQIGNSGRYGVQFFLVIVGYTSFLSLDNYFKNNNFNFTNLINGIGRGYHD